MVEENEEAMEAGRINLYTLDDAERDMSPHEYCGKTIEGVSGLDASIRKWGLIVEALRRLQDTAETKCGLCIEYASLVAHCEGCPIKDEEIACCKEFKSTCRSLDTTLRRAKAMLKRLRKAKEVQP